MTAKELVLQMANFRTRICEAVVSPNEPTRALEDLVVEAEIMKGLFDGLGKAAQQAQQIQRQRK